MRPACKSFRHQPSVFTAGWCQAGARLVPEKGVRKTDWLVHSQIPPQATATAEEAARGTGQGLRGRHRPPLPGPRSAQLPARCSNAVGRSCPWPTKGSTCHQQASLRVLHTRVVLGQRRSLVRGEHAAGGGGGAVRLWWWFIQQHHIHAAKDTAPQPHAEPPPPRKTTSLRVGV